MMSHASMAEFVEHGIEDSEEIIDFLKSRKDVLDKLVVQDIYAICCREAQRQFEFALKAWHKNPDSGMHLMLSNHYGAQHLAGIWRTVLDYFDVLDTGPTLETMLEAIKSLGLDPRIQFATAECRGIICRFILCQEDPQATVKSWIKNSRAITDRSAYQKYARYLNLSIEPDECRQYIRDIARNNLEKYEKFSLELTNRFNTKCDELTRTACSFRVGNTLLTDLHAQVSREWLRTYANQQKLKKELIRTNDKLLNQKHKSKDYSDVMKRMEAHDESPESSLPGNDEPDQSDRKQLLTQVKPKLRMPEYRVKRNISGHTLAGYGSNIRRYIDYLYKSESTELSEEPGNAARAELSASNPAGIVQQPDEEKPQCIAQSRDVQNAVITEVGKPAELPDNSAKGNPPETSRNHETTVNDKHRSVKISQMPVSPAAHAGSGQTGKAPNCDSASQGEDPQRRQAEEIRRLSHSPINKAPPEP